MNPEQSLLPESQDPLEKAMAETGQGLVPLDLKEPIATLDSPLKTLVLVPLWGLWALGLVTALLLGATRQASLQPILIFESALLAFLVLLQFKMKKERLLVLGDRVVRLKGRDKLSFPIKELTIMSRTIGQKTRYSLGPKEANIPGLFSQESGQDQTRTVEILMLLKRLGAKVEAPEWKADEAVKASTWLVGSRVNDISPLRLLLGTLIGVCGLAGVIALVITPILWVLTALVFLGAFAFLCFALIKARDRLAAHKPTGVLFARDQVAWLQKGKELWSVKPEDIRRFEVSGELGCPSFALVTNYGRRYDLFGTNRNELLRQINGRGYELVWSEKGKEEGRFLP